MATVTIQIPDEFLSTLDELVTQACSGTRETWVRNFVGSFLVDYQLKKDLGPEIQARNAFLLGFWQ